MAGGEEGPRAASAMVSRYDFLVGRKMFSFRTGVRGDGFDVDEGDLDMGVLRFVARAAIM